MYHQMKRNIIKIFFMKVLRKDLELLKDIKDKYLNSSVNKLNNCRRLIRKVKIHRPYLVMHPLFLQQVFQGIGFDIQNILNMNSQQTSNILNNSDIIEGVEQLSQNNSIIQQMFKELNLSTEYPDYSSVDYWNNRYSLQKEKCFEWLQSYSKLQPFIHNCLFGRFDISQILYVGCGNSQLQDYMQLDGIKNIRCIDFSDILIRQKQQQTIPYYLMDVTNKIDFEDEEFDFIIDKCLLDSLMSGTSFFERVSKYLSECYRILKPNGTFMIVSYGHPDTDKIKHFIFFVQIFFGQINHFIYLFQLIWIFGKKFSFLFWHI